MENDIKSAEPTTTARPTTLDEIRGKALIEVHSTTRLNLAALIEKDRASTYAAVARGDYPSIREGRRVRIPVGLLLRMLGYDAEVD